MSEGGECGRCRTPPPPARVSHLDGQRVTGPTGQCSLVQCGAVDRVRPPPQGAAGCRSGGGETVRVRRGSAPHCH